MEVNGRTFRKALGSFATGVTVVTARTAEGDPVGMTVTSFASVSLDPPLVMIGVGKTNSNIAAYRDVGQFAVNILSEDQRDVSITFASRVEDRWAQVKWRKGYKDLPLIEGALAQVQCDVHQVHEAGDHDIIIGRVKALDAATGGQPLLHFRGNYEELGCREV